MARKLYEGRKIGKVVIRDTLEGRRVACECLICNESFVIDNAAIYRRLKRKNLYLNCSDHAKSTALKRNTYPSVLYTLFREYEKAAERRNKEFDLALDTFHTIITQNCLYCGQAPTPILRKKLAKDSQDFKCLGIDRLDSSKGYIEGNVVPCCPTCNFMKQQLGYEEFISKMQQILRNLGRCA